MAAHRLPVTLISDSVLIIVLQVNFGANTTLGVLRTFHFTDDSLFLGSSDRTRRYQEGEIVCYSEGFFTSGFVVSKFTWIIFISTVLVRTKFFAFHSECQKPFVGRNVSLHRGRCIKVYL